MRRSGIAMLAVLGGCTVNSGIETTPTFAPARYVPPVASNEADPRDAAMASAQRRDQRLASEPRPVPYETTLRSGPVVTGAAAVAAANRAATIDPDSSTMSGATWVIRNPSLGSIYRIATAPKRATTLLLCDGERFSGAVGGNVEAFLINVAYSGPRPAVSVLPRMPGARGNLQLVTSGGFYSFDLVPTQGVALNVVDVQCSRSAAQQTAPANSAVPHPLGDFTRLSMTNPNGSVLPAWAPVEAWADTHKTVVRFATPVPVMPALFAGQKGEQMVTYRTETDAASGSMFLVTSRRVTEAELRLDQESVKITVDPVAVKAGTATTVEQGWQPASPLSQSDSAAPNVAVVVVPGNVGTPTLPTSSFSLPPNAFGATPAAGVSSDRADLTHL